MVSGNKRNKFEYEEIRAASVPTGYGALTLLRTCFCLGNNFSLEKSKEKNLSKILGKKKIFFSPKNLGEKKIFLFSKNLGEKKIFLSQKILGKKFFFLKKILEKKKFFFSQKNLGEKEKNYLQKRHFHEMFFNLKIPIPISKNLFTDFIVSFLCFFCL